MNRFYSSQLASSGKSPERLSPQMKFTHRLSPVRLVIILALCVFIGEAFVMFFLHLLPNAPFWFEAIFDSAMLITLLSPVLYLFVFRPFVHHISVLKRAEAELVAANAGLENRVAERTAELKANEEQLRLITDNLPGLVSYVDSDLRYRFNNKVYEDWFKRPREEIYGRSVKAVLGEKNFDKIKDHIDKALSGQSVSYESLIPYGDGKNRFINSTVLPDVNSEGQVKGLFTLVTDITQRKLAEQQLAAKAAELEKANEELSQYAYVVAHDLQAPLRAINNYANFIQEDMDSRLEGEQKENLEALGRAVHEANELVQGLLELSRIGRGGTSFESIHCGTLVREIINSTYLPANAKIKISDDWPTIEADAVMLRQIFQNLIENAVKFNNSPEIRVELSWRTQNDGHYEFLVSDNGIGIDSRYHEQIFRVFERLHTRKDYKGCGIGLAIVKKATSTLGGTIRLESNSDKGSRFYVTLPKTQSA
jgi:PAS domain S-box-containing protein